MASRWVYQVGSDHDLFEQRGGRWQHVWSQTTPTPNDPALLTQSLKARA